VKGKQLEFRFTRTGNDSIRYYYAENAYDYGHIVIGGGQLQQPPGSAPDLCMRVYGRMNPVASTWWGYQTWAGGDTQTLNQRGVAARAESAGVGLARMNFDWPTIWPDSADTFHFAARDTEAAYAANTMGCEVVGTLVYTAAWASSRTDDTWPWRCPPINLDRPAQDEAGNYWYEYVKTVVEHYNDTTAPGVHIWEIWNEPNDTWTYWKVPDRYYAIDDRSKPCARSMQGSAWLPRAQSAQSDPRILS